MFAARWPTIPDTSLANCRENSWDGCYIFNESTVFDLQMCVLFHSKRHNRERASFHCDPAWAQINSLSLKSRGLRFEKFFLEVFFISCVAGTNSNSVLGGAPPFYFLFFCSSTATSLGKMLIPCATQMGIMRREDPNCVHRYCAVLHPEAFLHLQPSSLPRSCSFICAFIRQWANQGGRGDKLKLLSN